MIATGFLVSTLQTNIDATKNINKESYLQAIANYLVTSPGAPYDWGASTSVPADFGLATTSSTIPYELDFDKVTRLNNQNNYSLSYTDIENSAKLNNVAIGITISQMMSISIEQVSNTTESANSSYTFTILTSIDSEPASANLICYVTSTNYLSELTGSTSDVGVGSLTVQIPTQATGDTLLIMFARAVCDQRITSYSIYNIASSNQETISSENILNLSPLNYTLNIFTSSSNMTIQNAYLFSYSYLQNLTYAPSTGQCAIPGIIDNSPFIILVSGSNGGASFQQWVAYPQVPLKAGSSFEDSEQNVFSYTVTIKGVLYNIRLSFGGLSSEVG